MTARTKALYQMVKDHILEGIAAGRYGVDDRVPSENELVEMLGVSRMTANRALKELAEAGVLVRISGVGTFVAERRTHGALLTIRDIADELAARGHRHSADVLVQERRKASPDLAEQFGIAGRSALFYARVLHRQDGVPVVLENRYVNPELAPDYLQVDLTRETSFRYLTRVAPLQEVEHVIRAVLPPAEVASLLDLAPGEPCLLVHRRTWTRGRVASVADLLHAGSRYQISGRFQP